MSREDDISTTQNEADLSNNEDDDTLASNQTKCPIEIFYRNVISKLSNWSYIIYKLSRFFFVFLLAQNTELSSVVHGTAESLINKLEENLSSAFTAAGDGNTDQVFDSQVLNTRILCGHATIVIYLW